MSFQPSLKRFKSLSGTAVNSSANSIAQATNAANAALDATVQAPVIPSSLRQSSSSPSQAFLSHLLLVSAAQIASKSDFTHTRKSVLQLIAEVAGKYVESVGVAASSSANESGRSEVNFYDILFGLNEMGLDFPEMRTWKEAGRDETPFAHALPHLPNTNKVIIVEPVTLPNSHTLIPQSAQPPPNPTQTASAASTALAAMQASSAITNPPNTASLGSTRPPHIPSHLPAFPPLRTYSYTSDLKSSISHDALATRKRKVEENRKLESALVTLHQAAERAKLELAISAEQELKVPLPGKPAAMVPHANSSTGVTANASNTSSSSSFLPAQPLLSSNRRNVHFDGLNTPAASSVAPTSQPLDSTTTAIEFPAADDGASNLAPPSLNDAVAVTAESSTAQAMEVDAAPQQSEIAAPTEVSTDSVPVKVENPVTVTSESASVSNGV